MGWVAASYQIATADTGPRMVRGHVMGGLGLHMEDAGSPAGRRKPRWGLSHLNTGHRVATLTGDREAIETVGAMFAVAGDWSFETLEGWRNQFPDALEKCRGLASAFPNVVRLAGGGGGLCAEQAGQIASGRWT